MKRKTIVLLSVAAVAVGTLATVEPVFAQTAATGLEGAANRIGSFATAGGKATYKIALLIGIALVIGGGMGIANAKKSNQPMAAPALLLVIGMLLSSVSAFIGLGSQTVLNKSEAEIEIKGLTE